MEIKYNDFHDEEIEEKEKGNFYLFYFSLKIRF